MDLATLALNRFGLGARPGDVKGIGADPRAALLAELNPETVSLAGKNLPTTATALLALRELQMERKEARAADSGASAKPKGAAGKKPIVPQENTMSDGEVSTPEMRAQNGTGMKGPARFYAAEILARMDRVQQADIGYVERLVAFWSNHFAIEAGAGQIERGLVGAFEREAIRPHVLGKFGDMLQAATRHPAMLAYLNNATSFGPNSPLGKRRDRGLNENHARELMELHTVGVGAGYSQTDVTELAKVLSGWSFSRGDADRFPPGTFMFRANAHEPGARTVFGKQYPDTGERQGLAVLADLAANSATATHIATKLVRSFVADDPPAPLVTRLAASFQSSGGDLLQLSRDLISGEEAWQGPGKFRTPQQFLWASTRALRIELRPTLTARVLGTLGQMPWDPPSPAGFDDRSATWLAPDAMTSRLDAAERFAELADPTVEPAALLDDLFGGSASAKTREAIARAESQSQGLALLLMSPEFQRT